MQRRNQIVMPVLPLVINRGATLHDILQLFGSKHFIGTGRTPDFLGKRQRSTSIAVSHANKAYPCFLVQRQWTFFLLFGTGQKCCNTLAIMGMKSKHSRPGQKSSIELERRVFRRGADQDNSAVFHDRQKRILLGAIKAMNFVYEKQGLASRHTPRASSLENLLEIGNAGEDRRNLFKREISFSGKQAGNGRLAGSRRSPEDHGTERTGCNHARQHTFWPGQMFLTGYFRQMLRTQAISKRPVAVRVRVCRC